MTIKGKMEMPNWWEWATFDAEGFVNGVAQDAPEDVQREYEDYIMEEKKRERNGIKA